MDIYIFMGFIWTIGWMYSCGAHSYYKIIVEERGDSNDRRKIAAMNKNGVLQYVGLFLFWPHYLGYGKQL